MIGSSPFKECKSIFEGEMKRKGVDSGFQVIDDQLCTLLHKQNFVLACTGQKCPSYIIYRQTTGNSSFKSYVAFLGYLSALKHV